MFANTCFVVFLVVSVSAIEDYCSVHTFRGNGNLMQFTKEPSRDEYAIVGNFKGLHCCAKGYRSIEWYKDNKPYPWPGTSSQLIIYPESANQTVYTQSVTTEDAGNYTCLLRNDTIVHAHTIQLKVFDTVPDDPKVTYISEATEAAIGGQLRLLCEAFVGRVDLPDAHNDAVWSKLDENGTIAEDEPRISQKRFQREDGQTFGSYLIIDDVIEEDFGEYVCTIKKPGKSINLPVNLIEKTDVTYINPNPLPWKKILLFSSIILLALLTLLILNIQYGLSLRVQLKDKFSRLEENDGKANDILIVYANKDSDISLGVLLPTFESKYNYKCATKELPENINYWCVDLAEASRNCRRIVAVISPGCLEENWDAGSIYEALKQLQQLDEQVCCILLKELPTQGVQIKNNQGESLSMLLRNIFVTLWERSKDDKFWLALRLRLPPRRTKDVRHHSRLNAHPHDGADILV